MTDRWDTIEGVTKRVEGWADLQSPGIVWIRYSSDVSRDIAIHDLSPEPKSTIRFEPPIPDQAAVWLEERLSQSVDSRSKTIPLSSVVFPIQREAIRATNLWPSLRALNLRRETLTHLPLVQLWWIDETIADEAEFAMPDLASWFQLRLWLREMMSVAEAIQTYGQLVQNRSDATLSYMADSLSLDSAKSYNLGKRAESLEAASEAVSLYRQLAGKQPVAFTQNLAAALSAFGVCLVTIGKREKATAAL